VNDFDFLIGQHAVRAALKSRPGHCMGVYTDSSDIAKSLKNEFKEIKAELIFTLGIHPFQEKAKDLFRLQGFEYQRITGQIFAVFSSRPVPSIQEVVDEALKLKSLGQRSVIVALDGVTDINNVGAILRTCAFYGVQHVLIGRKATGPFPPSMIRHSSGGYEYVSLHQCSHLVRTLQQLKSSEAKFQLIGLNEKATSDFTSLSTSLEHLCIVMGAEDHGISNAISRLLDATCKLTPLGALETLNVSVATAITLEKIFANNLQKTNKELDFPNA
jgi:23S rRNA (guanosine2251-2'-O)-methyltransferase